MNPPDYAEDILPEYTPALHRYNLVLYKRELKSPSVPISDWRWHLCVLELNSTQLNLYKLRDNNKLAKLLRKIIDFKSKVVDAKNDTRDNRFLFDNKFTDSMLVKWLLSDKNTGPIPLETVRPYIGARISSFTLQYAKIGAAKDLFAERNYILRVRLELEQMLLVFVNQVQYLQFNTDFKAARCVAEVLEDRVLKDISQLEVLQRFKGWKGTVCLPWDDICESRFSSLRKFEKLFFYFDEAVALKKRQESCKCDLLRYKKFIIKDCGVEECA